MPRKVPKRISPKYLTNLVNWYLEQYDAPVKHVRRLMMQRVRRAVAHHDQDLAECEQMLDDLLGRLVASGALDDHRYATHTVNRLRDRGQSARKIRASLSAKGVDRYLIDQVLAEYGEDDDTDPERIAAIRYAQRRRFGPWRRPDTPDVDDKARKELASMARAGFPYGLARDLIDSTDAIALEDEIPRGW